MLFFIKRKKGEQAPKEEKYTKTKVLAALSKLVDWEYGKKGTELRDQYDTELQSFRSKKDGRERPQS